jgi:hypothetical protein
VKAVRWLPLAGQPAQELSSIPFDGGFAMSWLLREMLGAGVILALQLEGQAATKSAGDVQEGLRITLLCYRYPPLAEPVMERAKEQVERIFRQAGVEVAWAACPTREGTLAEYPSCNGFHEPAHYSLHILSRGRKELKDAVQGEALLGSRLVYVFWDRTQRQADRYHVPVADMLAAVICHEIGHLLLGPDSHAQLGIMVGKWNPRALTDISQGGLGFTHEEQEQIRAELRKAR